MDCELGFAEKRQSLRIKDFVSDTKGSSRRTNFKKTEVSDTKSKYMGQEGEIYVVMKHKHVKG